ncbi:hypothetical protein Droror1_Dr00014023 [Drosera rotundifolia]
MAKLETKAAMRTPTVTANSMATVNSDGDDGLGSGGKLGGGGGLRRVTMNDFGENTPRQTHPKQTQFPLPSVPQLVSPEKKELGKEGLIVTKELKLLQSNPQRLDGYIRGSVSRLLKSDLVAVLAEDGRKGRITHREQEKKNTYRIQPERSLFYPLGSVGTDSKEMDILE